MRRAIEAVLWILFLGFCFVAGYLIHSPSLHLWTRLWGEPEPIRLITLHETDFPPELRTLLQEELGVPVLIEQAAEFDDLEVRLVPSTAPHVLWVNVADTRTLEQRGLLSPIQGLAREIEANLHPDFVESLPMIPFLWKFKDGKLEMHGLAFPRNNPDPSASVKLLQLLWKKEAALLMVNSAPENGSTLKILDGPPLPYARRPSALRDRSLNSGSR